MKKFMTISLAALFAAGFATAQDDVVIVEQGNANDDVEVTAEVALVSAYVWRGQVLNNDFTLQPQISLSTKGVSFNVWGNYDAIPNNNGSDGDFSEIDISMAYTLPVDLNDVSFDVGFINYNFPANGDTTVESTTELFASATLLTWSDYFIPTTTFFGDVNEVEGSYILFEVAVPFEVSDVLAVEGGVSAGWGNTSYNSAYWKPDAKAGFNDYNFYGVASYELAEDITASVNLTYTLLEGGQIRDAAADNGGAYEADEKLWVGVNLAYDF